MEEIKKIGERIYEFNFLNCELKDGEEIITNSNVSEFVSTFRKRDIDKGLLVTPSGYQKGLVYKKTNGGEFYNNPSWLPDIVTFSFNIFGLKRGQFYKLTVKGRDTRRHNAITDITADRSLEVSNELQELIIHEDLKNIEQNTEYSGIFRTKSNEANLFFKIGKIYINNIIIEEIELLTEEEEEKEEPAALFSEGKERVVAFGVFTTLSSIIDPETFRGRYLPMNRLTGKGINLYFDKIDNQYILERDNIEDTINDSFINSNFYVDFNFNKLVNKGFFSQYNITEVKNEISLNTLKQGYIKFEFVNDAGIPVEYKDKDGRLTILIKKII